MNKKLQYILLTLVSLFAINANAAPMAYSVNSDSGNPGTQDSLYLIDLATGGQQRRGTLISGINTRIDTEGLAISRDGTLWGIDDDSMTLFPINTASGTINFLDEIPLIGLPNGGGNDFGMTFSCNNSLYITSVATQTLYRLGMDGSSQVVGTVGALGVNISALAAYGSPTQLYGLGNGLLQNGSTDSPNLYRIDTTTGIATLVGPLGPQASIYNQGGMGFDTGGNLWAITDRRINAADPSEILQINVGTGAATLIATTGEVGFESLAVAPPAACGYDYYPRIPTLDAAGRLLAVFILLFAGLTVLRRRYH